MRAEQAAALDAEADRIMVELLQSQTVGLSGIRECLTQVEQAVYSPAQKLCIPSSADYSAFARSVRAQLMSALEETHEELLQYLAFVQQDVRGQRVLLDAAGMLKECEACLAAMKSCMERLRSTIVVPPQPEFLWWNKQRAVFNEFLGGINNVRNVLNGLRTRLEPHVPPTSVNWNMLAPWVAMMEKNHLHFPNGKRLAMREGDEMLRSILQQALKYDTPGRERLQVIWKELSWILENIRQDFVSVYPDEEEADEDTEEGIPDLTDMAARSSTDEENRSMNVFEEIEEYVRSFLTVRMEQLRRLLQEKPRTAERKGKDEVRKQATRQRKAVLKMVEAIIVEFVQLQRMPEGHDHFFINLHEIAKACQTIGVEYGKNYQTTVIVPEDTSPQKPPDAVSNDESAVE